MKTFLTRLFFPVRILLLLGPLTLSAQKNAGDLYPKDSIFFEINTIPYTIDNSQPGNCWQAGHPSKTLFNEAYSAPLAIVTDTNLPYPVNNLSSFSFMIIDTANGGWDPPCGGATYFEFLHRYDSDTLTDFGSVYYSFDRGSTWTVMRDSIFSGGIFGFSTYMWAWDYETSTGQEFQHVLNPSGRSNGWIRSRFTWQWFFPVKGTETVTDFPDTILVKFTFRSDGIQNNREGWMIDNIVTGCMDVGSGIPSQGVPLAALISPNPLTGSSVVHASRTIENPFLEIFDPLGHAVFRHLYHTGEPILLNRGDFTAGLFFWRLTDESGRSCSGKLLVE